MCDTDFAWSAALGRVTVRMATVSSDIRVLLHEHAASVLLFAGRGAQISFSLFLPGHDQG